MGLQCQIVYTILKLKGVPKLEELKFAKLLQLIQHKFDTKLKRMEKETTIRKDGMFHTLQIPQQRKKNKTRERLISGLKWKLICKQALHQNETPEVLKKH